MVCSRCKMIIKNELIRFGLHPISTELGEVEITEDLTKEDKDLLQKTLLPFGFEIIDDKKSRVIEKIKNVIVESVHYSEEKNKLKFSEHLSASLHLDYSYLSNLFSEAEGTTIEKYLIAQKTEKVKELLKYDELSLSQIADRLGYSSVAYLSKQFKEQTGFTATHFKAMLNNSRKNLDDL